jgi:hypothetical protein
MRRHTTPALATFQVETTVPTRYRKGDVNASKTITTPKHAPETLAVSV